MKKILVKRTVTMAAAALAFLIFAAQTAGEPAAGYTKFSFHFSTSKDNNL